MSTLTLVAASTFLLIEGCCSVSMSSSALFVQSGQVTMPHQSRPTNDGWTLVYHSAVIFPGEFKDVPQIQLTMSSIEAYSRKEGTFYRLQADNVTKSGFDLNIYGAYMDSFSNCTVAWTAIQR